MIKMAARERLNILLLLKPPFPKSVCTFCREEGETLCDVDDQIERGQNCWRTLERGCLDDSLSDILENQYFVFNVV